MSAQPKFQLKVLSTGKSHISYSELADWVSCQYKHKLKHVDKLGFDNGSIHTIFGQVVHDALEERVNHRKGLHESVQSPDFWRDKFSDDYFAFLLNENYSAEQKIILFGSDKEKDKTIELYGKFIKTFDNILQNVIEWLDINFPEWELIDAEVQIFEPISDDQKDISFKGFIDLIIRTPKFVTRKGVQVKVPNKYVYWILDWKTTDWGWRRAQKESHIKQIQLLFYKHYFCLKNNIDIKEANVGWILVKRSPKKGELPFELITFPSTKKKIEEAIFIARQMISALNLKYYFKNWNECFYCVYRGTDHCRVVQPGKSK
jgi:hypothetical protein